MKNWLLIVMALSLFLSEIMLKLNPVLGFLFYSVLIGGCLISLSKPNSLNNHGKLIIIFMILPIFRISELFIEFNFLWRSLILYYILGFLVVYYSFNFKINPGYTKKNLKFILPAILLGIIFGLIGNELFVFEKNLGLLFLLPIIAFSEEVLFRGLIQNLISKEYSAFYAIFFTSFFYGIFSLGFGSLIALFFFFISIIISTSYYFTKNIYVSILFSFMFHLIIFVL